MKTKEKNEIRQELAAYNGKFVRVTQNENGCFPGAGFPTGIMIAGRLERHPDDHDSFRVYNDESTYAYFRTEDVDMVNPIASICTIVLTIPAMD